MRFWRTFRLLFLIVMFFAVSLFLVVTTPWGKWFGKLPDYAGVIAEGDPIVGAIDGFHAERGLWPEYLEDLVPGYLAKAPGQRWYYERDHGAPTLSVATEARRTHVGYELGRESSGWRVFGETDNRVLRSDVGVASTHPATMAKDKLVEEELAELDRRIAREPTWVEHWRGKVSLLRWLGRVEEAREVVGKAEKELPEYFWPALAEGELRGGAEGVAAFAEWVKSRPSLPHFYYLSVLEREMGKDVEALKAMEEALGCPNELGALGDDTEVLPFYFWDMARFALEKGDDDLVVRLTTAWEKSQKGVEGSDGSYLALRAAAENHLGKGKEALADLDLLAGRKGAIWAKNVAGLREAVQRGESTFRYAPGEKPGMYQIFELPE